MKTALLGLAALVAAGCAIQPTITHTRSTLGEVDMTGMVCRTEKPVGSNSQQTVCASREAWARYDANGLAQANRLLDDAKESTNVRQFGALR